MTIRRKVNVSITVCTEEMVDLCYPEYNDEEKLEMCMLRDLDKVSLIEKEFNVDVEEVRRVALGQDYLDWIRLKGYSNNENSRIAYASEVSDEKAEEIWKENGMDSYIMTGLLPVVVMCEGSYIKRGEILLSERVEDALIAYVSDMFKTGVCDSWVYAGLTESVIWNWVEDASLFDYVASRIEGSEKEYRTSKVLTSSGQRKVDIRFIPFGVHKKTSYKVTKNELEEYVVSDKNAYELSDVINEDVKNNRINCIAFPFFVPVADAEQARSDLLASLR